VIPFSTESLIVLAIGCLVLDWFAFRFNAAEAGHGRKQMLRMAAIWTTTIVGVTFAFSLAHG